MSRITHPPVLDYRRLKNGTALTWLGLVVGSWASLLWAGAVSLPIGVGAGVLAGTALGGFLAVPVWGTVFGRLGMSRARDSAARAKGIDVLGPEDPLTQRVYALCDRLGMSARPWVAVMDPCNAYAIGSRADKALVVIGRPLLDHMTQDEVDAVISHELGHIANNDMRRMAFCRSFQNALTWYLGFSNTLQKGARYVLSWVSELMILRLSRKREYWADAIGAALTSKEAMVSALEKIHGLADGFTDHERANLRLMFRGRTTAAIFSTHPTLEQRCSALHAQTYLARLPHLSRKIDRLDLPAPDQLPSQPMPDITAAEIAYAQSPKNAPRGGSAPTPPGYLNKE